MVLKEFLKLHKNGMTKGNVSVCKVNELGHTDVLLSNMVQDDIINSENFSKVANRQVVKFCVLGGCNNIPVELVIYIQ